MTSDQYTILVNLNQLKVLIVMIIKILDSFEEIFDNKNIEINLD